MAYLEEARRLNHAYIEAIAETIGDKKQKMAYLTHTRLMGVGEVFAKGFTAALGYKPTDSYVTFFGYPNNPYLWLFPQSLADSISQKLGKPAEVAKNVISVIRQELTTKGLADIINLI